MCHLWGIKDSSKDCPGCHNGCRDCHKAKPLLQKQQQRPRPFQHRSHHPVEHKKARWQRVHGAMMVYSRNSNDPKGTIQFLTYVVQNNEPKIEVLPLLLAEFQLLISSSLSVHSRHTIDCDEFQDFPYLLRFLPCNQSSAMASQLLRTTSARVPSPTGATRTVSATFGRRGL